MDPIFIKATAANIALGKTVVCQIAGQSILICHIDGAYHAVENKCSHNDAPLDRARIREGRIMCPVHGAKFDPVSGAALCPPAVAPLRVFPTRLVDGWVEVCVAQEPANG